MNDLYRERLVRRLRAAYSGELGAALAYAGHWRSVSNSQERQRIQEIESDEWHHRRLVRDMLVELGGRPSMLREAIFWMIGRSVALFCHVGGWFCPMYGAGRLERTNIVEYEDAVADAIACGRNDFAECFLSMAEVEWEHERFFREAIEGHWMTRVFAVWSAPPPKEEIRAIESDRARFCCPSST